METIETIAKQQVEALRPQTTPAERILSKKQLAAKAKRAELKKLSDKLWTEAGDKFHHDGKPITINELIEEYWCNQWQLDHLELRTYEEWKKLGYQVKRGEKAIQKWGPKAIWHKNQLLDETGNPIPNTGEAIEYCQVLNLFDITQTYHVENCK